VTAGPAGESAGGVTTPGNARPLEQAEATRATSTSQSVIEGWNDLRMG
jgi:hypothetical protein